MEYTLPSKDEGFSELEMFTKAEVLSDQILEDLSKGLISQEDAEKAIDCLVDRLGL